MDWIVRNKIKDISALIFQSWNFALFKILLLPLIYFFSSFLFCLSLYLFILFSFSCILSLPFIPAYVLRHIIIIIIITIIILITYDCLHFLSLSFFHKFSGPSTLSLSLSLSLFISVNGKKGKIIQKRKKQNQIVTYTGVGLSVCQSN